MFKDSLDNPFEVAIENLPNLLTIYLAQQQKEKQKAVQKLEDKATAAMGIPPTYRDPSGEIMEDLLSITPSQVAFEQSLRMKRTKVVAETFKSYVDFKQTTIDDAKTSLNQYLTKLHGSDSTVKNKIGKIGDLLTRLFY